MGKDGGRSLGRHRLCSVLHPVKVPTVYRYRINQFGEINK